MLEPPSFPRNGRRLLIFPLKSVSCTSTCVPCGPTVGLVLSETEEPGLIHVKFKQFLPIWGLTGQFSRFSCLHMLPLLSAGDFLQSHFTCSVLCWLAQQTHSDSAFCLLFPFSAEANFKSRTRQKKSQGMTSSDILSFFWLF